MRIHAMLLMSIFLGATSAIAAPKCVAQSGAEQATLIELYTSEGCSSCPPADRWLSGFTKQPNPQIIPLAFHVDYWDYIGWKDRFANPVFTARQHLHQRATNAKFVYTPQTVINANDTTAWRQARSPGQLATTKTSKPGAEIKLESEITADGSATVHIKSTLSPSAGEPQAVAYLALYENGLNSAVHRGENAGKHLQHDYVVRQLIGPLAFDSEGRLDAYQRISLAGINPEKSGIAAIVESRDGTRFHQALTLPLCK